MVVAGRVVTPPTARGRRDHDGRGRGHRRRLEPDQGEGGAAPTEEIVAAGPRGRQAVHRRARARRSSELAAKAAKPTAGVPAVPRLPGRRVRRRRGRRSPDDARRRRCTIADKQERETGSTRSRTRVIEQLGRAVRGPREGALRRVPRRCTKKLVRQRILRDKVRIDGRGLARHPPALGRGRGPPARARLGAVRARRDPDPGRHHAEHAADGAAARHAVARRRASATCTTTTSRRTPPARPAASARRSGARSATARSPSGR